MDVSLEESKNGNKQMNTQELDEETKKSPFGKKMIFANHALKRILDMLGDLSDTIVI